MILAALAAIVLGSETIHVAVTPKFRDGVHFACETDFEVIVQDTAYHQGQPVVVSGSFAIYNWPDPSRLFVVMKLGLLPDANGAWRAPTNAYVVNGYRSNLSEQQAQSNAENPGFRLFVYDLTGEQTITAIARLTAESRLDVAYTLDGGSMPMTFPVQLTEDMSEQWGDCVEALAGRDAGDT